MEITYELEKEDIIKGEQGTGNRRFYFEEKKIKNCKLMIFFLLRVPENEIASLHSQRFAILYLTDKGNAIISLLKIKFLKKISKKRNKLNFLS